MNVNVNKARFTRQDVEDMLLIATRNVQEINNAIRHYEAIVNALPGKVNDLRREHYRGVIRRAKRKVEEEQAWVKIYNRVLNPNQIENGTEKES